MPLDHPFTGELETAPFVRRTLPILFLIFFWCWETWRPCFRWTGRWLHAGRNLLIAIVNAGLVALLLGLLLTTVLEWTRSHRVGLLNNLELAWEVRLPLGLLLLDGWMYCWHRANHVVPLLWRFHRMHHSDRKMDVTTATRFHLGELLLSTLFRLVLILVLGLDAWHIVVYEVLLQAVVQFHHANISLGNLDGWIRLVMVTPNMHKVHHSDRLEELNSNYSTILSIWDRLFASHRERTDMANVVFGLPEFAEPEWETLGGMLRIPFTNSTVGERGK
jgi:sterol desaturase/sphingolipid hydroxylase (fatty acid hydroxylase superfamily)